jgi:aminoglycoside phosphotransferase (APT) family kinase protein
MTADITVKLAARIRAAVERELNRVEETRARLAPDVPAEAERAARTLAALVRTLHALDAVERRAPAEPEEEEIRDLDEFRRELTRRLAAIRARRAG